MKGDISDRVGRLSFLVRVYSVWMSIRGVRHRTLPTFATGILQLGKKKKKTVNKEFRSLRRKRESNRREEGKDGRKEARKRKKKRR